MTLARTFMSLISVAFIGSLSSSAMAAQTECLRQATNADMADKIAALALMADAVVVIIASLFTLILSIKLMIESMRNPFNH